MDRLARMLSQAAGGVTPTYIEDVFSTHLYTGTGATQTITNGIDLAGKGGFVWIKHRTNGGVAHRLYDTLRGPYKELYSNLTDAQVDRGDLGVSAFNSNGFSLGNSYNGTNELNGSYASWTFRKQPKFFDVVTYTGNGANRTIAHNLGSVPGCIIVKKTSDTGGGWFVYHRSIANTDYLLLNTTDASASGTTYWNSTTPTSTVFSLGTGLGVNQNGSTYVAYLFAHDTAADGLIQCGSFVDTPTTQPVVELGWEPQWLLIKRASPGGSNFELFDDWYIADNMRGLTVDPSDRALQANMSGAEGSAAVNATPRITATGFAPNMAIDSTDTFIYIAIRRGPMKTPTTGASVFSPITYSGIIPGAGSATRTSGFPIDLIWARLRNGTVNFGAGGSTTGVLTRLTGGLWTGNSTIATPILGTLSVDAETTQHTGIFGASSTGFETTGNIGGLGGDSGASETYIAECFRRAPGFFDVVCYTGNDLNVQHNLQVMPELIISKPRNSSTRWYVYATSQAVLTSGNWFPGTYGLGALNSSNAFSSLAYIYIPDGAKSTTFHFGDGGLASTTTHVAYLFATLSGVSKVGSYTGNGSSQTINCGFTTGARFVLIKRTDSTGDWYVWDTARGIVAANDPHLSLNSTAAEVTTNDSIDPDNTGFIVNQVAATNINVTSATYIFLAIA